MSGRGVIKALSNMSIDEVSLVDRGANQHALISFAKRAPDVDDVFEKARGGVTTMKANDDVSVETHHGDDPADVVDEFVQNEGKGVGPGKPLSVARKTSGKVVNGRSAPAGSVKGKGSATDDGDADDEVEKALSALGLYLEHEDDEVEKNFGAQSPFPQQQPQAPQFGNPPAMQSVGAQPMGMGAPQAPPGQGAPSMGMPGPQMPGMGASGLPGMGQQPPMQLPQLPPEVIQYIQQLEQKLAGAQKQDGTPEGSDSGSSDSSNASSGDSSDSSNKPFGKGYNVDTSDFLEELSKALRDEDQVEAVSKAFAAQQYAFAEELSKRDQVVAELEEVAKSERDLRLEREFISKAAEFDVPVAPEELGPVLKRAAESLDMADFSVIVKCLDAAGAGEALFGEFGKRGTADNTDIFEMVEASAEELAKSYELTGPQAVSAAFEQNPALYDQFVANQRQNRL